MNPFKRGHDFKKEEIGKKQNLFKIQCSKKKKI